MSAGTMTRETFYNEGFTYVDGYVCRCVCVYIYMCVYRLTNVNHAMALSPDSDRAEIQTHRWSRPVNLKVILRAKCLYDSSVATEIDNYD